MGALGIPEIILTTVLFTFYAGLLAAGVFVVVMVHRIQRETVQIRALLVQLTAHLDTRS